MKKSVYVEDMKQTPSRFYLGKYFPLDTWNGADIFKVENKPIMFFSKEVIDLITSSDLKLGPLRYEKVKEVKLSPGLVEM